ncbi:cytochrome P450 [Acaryochloris sp. IP29b_bin.148]|uniref:cytochrome P450 n=1 Tax=Acaryochloris sp. IP29b_bin.148 TaxID=2969218 RepID=UPI00261BE13B|nr:cytochrome P450 [Acaryochloris sp. IP29b_bin.148]
MKIFYVVDVISYSIVTPQEFLGKRQKIFGNNFAALGRIIVGEYNLTAKIIAEPQQREPYIGRFRCIPERFSKNFLLFLSDQEVKGNTAHKKARSAVLEVVFKPAFNNTESREAKDLLHQLATLAHQHGNPPDLDEISDDIQRTIIQYIMLVLLEVKLSPQQLSSLKTLFFSAKPRESLLISRVKPLAPSANKLQEVKRLEAIALNLIENSPVISRYVPTTDNDLSRTELSTLLLEAIAIAGCLGSESLLRSLLTKVPQDLEIDVEDRFEVLRVVLETARRYAPVNNINTITQAETAVTINGRKRKFPKGTLFSANIGLANLDGTVFKNPLDFNPHRDNLMAALSFNSVGEAKRRECPGRGIAEKMGSDLLVALQCKPTTPVPAKE